MINRDRLERDFAAMATLTAPGEGINRLAFTDADWAEHAPTGMIFIPCLDGISHNPAEFAEMNDIVIGTQVLESVIRKLANSAI